MIKLFLSGVILAANADAFFTAERPLKVASEALENVADIGSGLVSAAADAAAASAGLGAHAAGRAAADAGALAAAASGLSAASTLAGDVIGGHLSAGADLISGLMPRPFQHAYNAATLGAVGLTSHAAGLVTGNHLASALGHPSFLIPSSIYNHLLSAAQYHLSVGAAALPHVRWACASFLGALFGLKPAQMPPSAFYQSVKAVIDSFYDQKINAYQNASPDLFINKLYGELTKNYTIDFHVLTNVQNTLHSWATAFPLGCSGLFLQALHDICGALVQKLAYHPLLFPHTLTNDLQTVYDSLLIPGPDAEIPITLPREPVFDTSSALPYPDEIPTDYQDVPSETRTYPLLTHPWLRPYPFFPAHPLLSHTTLTPTIPTLPEPVAQPTARPYAFPFQLPSITGPAFPLNPLGGFLKAPQLFAPPADKPEEQHEEQPSFLRPQAPILSNVVGVASVAGYGAYPLIIGPSGELSVSVSSLGLLPLRVAPNGDLAVNVPGIGALEVSVNTTIAAAVSVPGFGVDPLGITADGHLIVSLPGLGATPVTKSETGELTAHVEGVGSVFVTSAMEARTVVEIPGYGLVPMTINAKDAIMEVTLPGIGRVPINIDVDGQLTVHVPDVGLICVRGIQMNGLPPMLDSINIPRLGIFPVDTSATGALTVTIPGYGVFPVTRTFSGRLHVVIPGLGTFDVIVGTPPPAPTPASIQPLLNYVPDYPPLTPYGYSWNSGPSVYTVPDESDEPAEEPEKPVAAPTPMPSRTMMVAPPAYQSSHQLNIDSKFQSKWVWSVSDAAVYFLQKLDVFRPSHMPPEHFLNIVNDTIIELKINYRGSLHLLSPAHFIRVLCGRLGGAVDLTPVTIESIGDHVATSLEGPFPPFEEILDHISAVITEKLDN